jgi:hypothetical protein
MLPDAAFGVDRNRKSGLANRCRDCDNAKRRRYYEENREQELERIRAYQATLDKPPRVCLGCGGEPTSQKHWYCDACRASRPRHRRRERERLREQRRDRPGPTERGYGTEHQKLRRRWAAVLAEQFVRCARCGGVIRPGDPWDLGHDDYDRSVYTGPEHRRCNRATAGRKPKRATSRAW